MAAKVLSPYYKLGQTVFVVECCDNKFVDILNKLLPAADESEARSANVLTVEAGCSDDVYALFRHIRMRHSHCVWMDAGCAMSPAGKKVLLIGGSDAGKSTTCLALATLHSWKIFAEDVTLFDLENNLVLTFPTPFSIKGGTPETLATANIDLNLDGMYEEWLPMGNFAAPEHADAHFDLVLYFEDIARDANSFGGQEVSAAEMVRRILSWSSMVRIKGAPDKIAEYFSTARCYVAQGGSLNERLQFITSHA